MRLYSKGFRVQGWPGLQRETLSQSKQVKHQKGQDIQSRMLDYIAQGFHGDALVMGFWGGHVLGRGHRDDGWG